MFNVFINLCVSYVCVYVSVSLCVCYFGGCVMCMLWCVCVYCCMYVLWCVFVCCDVFIHQFVCVCVCVCLCLFLVECVSCGVSVWWYLLWCGLVLCCIMLCHETVRCPLHSTTLYAVLYTVVVDIHSVKFNITIFSAN